MKTNADKAINYIQLYRMDHEVGYLFDAKRMINRELKERKKALQSAIRKGPEVNNLSKQYHKLGGYSR